MLKVKLERKEILAAYKDCFESSAGQIVLDDLSTVLSRLSYSPDPYATAFCEGERNAVLKIVSKVRAANTLTVEELDDVPA